MTPIAAIIILYKSGAVPLVDLLCACICMSIICMYVIVIIKRLTIPGGKSLVVCADLSVKRPHTQLGVGRVMTSGPLGSVMVCKRSGFEYHSRHNISHFHRYLHDTCMIHGIKLCHWELLA